jgi:galactokinase
MHAGATPSRKCRAPGRANIIGEHTDYNRGLALPFAIQYGVDATYRHDTDDPLTVVAEGFGSFVLGDVPTAEWQRLAKAAVDRSSIRFGTLCVRSDLPVGAGLSSSAAYVGAIVLALGASGSSLELARQIQACEHDVGRGVGLLDPLASLAGRAGCALLIDFSTLATKQVRVPQSVAFSAVDTGVRRSLEETRYLERRSECERAEEMLGDWATASLQDAESLHDRTLRRRARHVVTENERVRAAVAALQSDDPRALGTLISDSHRSLSENFDVSTPEIDGLVERIERLPGVLGARLMGGGFGGCVLAVHDPGASIALRDQTTLRLVPSDGAVAPLGEAPAEGAPR